MKRFRLYTLVENTFMPMLLPEKEKELQFRSISTLMLTQVELKTFHVEITTSPNCILLFIYPQFITLNTRTAAVKKKKVKLLECDHTLAESKCHEKFDI